jgi:hypothetical protein
MICVLTAFRLSIGEDTPAAIWWGRGPEHG